MLASFELVGLDGSNPLGFLAALGTLVSLQDAGLGRPQLSWKCLHRWVPVVHGVTAESEADLARLVADSLEGKVVGADAEE